jgi:hypothetical protein
MPDTYLIAVMLPTIIRLELFLDEITAVLFAVLQPAFGGFRENAKIIFNDNQFVLV